MWLVTCRGGGGSAPWVVHVSFDLLWVNNPSNPKGLVGLLVWSRDLRCIPGQSSSSCLNWDVLCSPEGSARRFSSAELSLSSLFSFVLWPEIPSDQKGAGNLFLTQCQPTREPIPQLGLGNVATTPSGWRIRKLPQPRERFGTPRGGMWRSPTWSARLTPKLSCLHRELSEDTELPLLPNECPWWGRALLPAPHPKGIALLFRGRAGRPSHAAAGRICSPKNWVLLTKKMDFFPPAEVWVVSEMSKSSRLSKSSLAKPKVEVGTEIILE